MRKFFSLLKTALNINFGISALKYRFTKEKKKRWEPVLAGIGAFFGIAYLLVLFSFMMFGIFILGKNAGRPDMVLTLALVAGQIVILVFGIFYVMGAFYFSRDMNILIPLPLKPSYVLGSKFAVVMINEYLTLIPFLLPAIIIYGIGMKQGIFYWIKSVLIFLTVPAIPLILASLFILLLMRFVNVRKSKDLLAVAGGFLGLFIALGVNFYLQSMPKGSNGEFVGSVLDLQSKLIESIGKRFPPGIWATYGLSHAGIDGLGYMALFIGVSLLMFLALMWIGNRIFYKSILSGQEISRKRKTLSHLQVSRQYEKKSSPVIAVFHKEWKLFLRTPLYLMNGVVGMIIAPFLLVMPFIADKTSAAEIYGFITDPGYSVYVSLGGLGLMLFVSNLNIIANTSISREGETFWISKMIPVSARHQIMGKILHCIAVELIGILITGVVLFTFVKLTMTRVLIVIILSVIGSLALIALNLMVDVARPKLEWTNPQEAVKRNMNSFLGMLVTFAVLGVLAAVAFGIAFLGVAEWLIYVILAILMIAVAIPSIVGLFSLAEYRYGKIEM